jgi:hypothetical protein
LTAAVAAPGFLFAFRYVVLGNGIGLFQGQAMDDYEMEETCDAARQRDEKDDWSIISADTLNQCNSSLSFFDAEGMRFHLPAFLIADLKDQLRMDPIFHLAYLNDYSISKLVLLSPAQRSAVRNYLLLAKENPNNEYDCPHIEKALSEYWAEPAAGLSPDS